jgi:hypothetical protein
MREREPSPPRYMIFIIIKNRSHQSIINRPPIFSLSKIAWMPYLTYNLNFKKYKKMSDLVAKAHTVDPVP